MNTEPVILVLEDERPQILALRATLEPIGRVVDFSDPQQALDYMQEQLVDAAVIDVHMPNMPINGVEFIRAMRTFDKDVAVIIRTGDPSVEIADHAIELQAYRRVIKSKTSVQEMRQLLRAGIAETRTRRKISRDANATARVSRQLERTLGSVEDELSSAECYKGMLHSIRNQLTAMAGFAEVWSAVAKKNNHPVLSDVAAENDRIVSRMLADMNAFLDGPFADLRASGDKNACAEVNATLEVLRKRFAAPNPWSAKQKSLEVSPLSQPLFVSAPPVKLLTAMRHVAEYCLQSSPPGARVVLSAHYVRELESHIDQTLESELVFNRPVRPNETGYVRFLFAAGPITKGLQQIHQEFHSYPEDPRTGNLHMLSLSFGEERCTVAVHVAPNLTLSFQVFVPTSR